MQERRPHDIQDAIERGMRLVDERTGIIQGLYDLPLEPQDPRFFHIAAPLTDTLRYFGVRCYRHNGGAALTRERAIMSAIGESIERYCAGLCDPGALTEATVREMGDRAVDPRRFVLFSERQYGRAEFPLSRPDDSTVMRWIEGRSLTNGRAVYVPACFVYVPYPWRDKSEAITAPISTGLACGSSLDDAVLRGIYEVVERDSFSLVWLNMLPVPKIDVTEPGDPELAAVLERFRDVGLDVCVNLATSDLGIPVVITLSLDRTGAGPASVIAARSDFDIEKSIMRSLEETAQTRLWARKLMRDRPDYEPEPGFTDVVRGEDHVRLFCNPDMSEHLRFLTEAPIAGDLRSFERPPGDARCRVTQAVAMLARKGYEVIAVDITTPDIYEAGFCVVRVLIPGLQPLDMDFNWRYLGGKRLYEAPVRMGYSAEASSEDRLNPVPHPFP